jgi:hypothetical protein
LNASSDEVMFCLWVRSYGFDGALYLAQRSRLRCQRPLQELKAMFNESSRSERVRRYKQEHKSGNASSKVPQAARPDL